MYKYAALALVLFASPAYANCTCACVDGRVQALCEPGPQLPPLCGPRLCQTPGPSLRPLQGPVLPPLGTRSCSQRQVLNPYTNQYNWQLICH